MADRSPAMHRHFSVISGAREICLFTLSAGGPHNQRWCSGAHGQVMRKEIRSEFNQVRRRYRQHQGLIESPGCVCCHLQHQGTELVQGAPYPREWMSCERAEGAQPASLMPLDLITLDRAMLLNQLPVCPTACGWTLADGKIWLGGSRAVNACWLAGCTL